jgi:hypothetical protein
MTSLTEISEVYERHHATIHHTVVSVIGHPIEGNRSGDEEETANQQSDRSQGNG